MMNTLELDAKNTPISATVNAGDSRTRNIGIDALRLLSMIYVVILHVLGQGGVLENTVGFKNDIAWLLEIIAFCSVDAYALISGYVGYSEEFKPFKTSKYLSIWLQVLCYSFGITFLAFLIKPQSIGLNTLVKSFFPVATNQYWYFTAFAVVFLLKPWLNRFIRSLTKKELTAFSLVVLSLFSIYETFANHLDSDPFKLSGGYCVLWLILIYVIGAWLKKCNIVDVISNRVAWLVIVIGTLITWAGRQYASAIGADVLVSYVSPTVTFSAIAYVIIFSRLKVSGKLSKIIALFAPAAFGVYLIHVHPIVFNSFFGSAFAWISNYPTWQVPIYVVGCALAVFVGCILIEKLRLLLFKLLRINDFADTLGNKIDCLLLNIKKRTNSLLKIDD